MQVYRYVPARPKPQMLDYRAGLIAAIDDLPPLPMVLDRLMQMLEDADSTTAQIATLIEKDVVLSGSVLRCVNSAYYGLSATVSSIRHAVSLLGLTTIRNLALAFSWRRLIGSSRTPPPRLYARFSQHSIGCAILCHFLLHGDEAEEAAFAAGLFHDVGKLLILTTLPDLLPTLVERYERGEGDWQQVEMETLNLTHPQLSRMVLQKWQLPVPIQLAVEYHHRPEACPAGSGAETLAHVVHAADIYINRYGAEILPTKKSGDTAHPEQVFARLGLEQRLPQALESFRREYEGLRDLF